MITFILWFLVLLIIIYTIMGLLIYIAPYMDDNGNITKPGKKLSNLFKRK